MNVPNVDGNEEDVLVQGSSYHENGEDPGEHNESKGHESKHDDFIKKLLKNKVILVGIFIVCMLVIVSSIVVASMRSKQETEESSQTIFMEEEPAFVYTLEEKEGLRLAGYTGNEIEAFEYEGRNSIDLIQQAAEERQKQYEREAQPYFDSASDEFKELWEDSWVGQKDLKFDSNIEHYTFYNETINVDYEKLSAKGYQLFIKFYLMNGDACFMTVTPERYQTLNEKGNIVLNVDYTKTGDGKIIITNIIEVTP